MRSLLSKGAWGKFAERLAPHESPASRMVQTAGSRAQLAKLFGGLDDKEVELLVYDL